MSHVDEPSVNALTYLRSMDAASLQLWQLGFGETGADLMPTLDCAAPDWYPQALNVRAFQEDRIGSGLPVTEDHLQVCGAWASSQSDETYPWISPTSPSSSHISSCLEDYTHGLPGLSYDSGMSSRLATLSPYPSDHFLMAPALLPQDSYEDL